LASVETEGKTYPTLFAPNVALSVSPRPLNWEEKVNLLKGKVVPGYND
jgi:hypothetical protein